MKGSYLIALTVDDFRQLWETLARLGSDFHQVCTPSPIIIIVIVLVVDVS